MNRRTTVSLAALGVALLSALPAHAAKPRPKPIKGTYKVQLVPDPSINAQEGCGVLPLSQDKHPFTVPAKGTLVVRLSGGDLPGGGADWDLYTLDGAGNVISASESDSAHEMTVDKFKKRTNVSFWVCNLAGAPDGTVSYTFTYA